MRRALVRTALTVAPAAPRRVPIDGAWAAVGPPPRVGEPRGHVYRRIQRARGKR
ncbi:hypothetical protein [Nonomuraea sp. NPDC049309]|uniref:hypothetical protein n=1 Tax=Nonomuraea sp. NPDC049309 TaxID=3364350 RepID=UPI00371F9A18